MDSLMHTKVHKLPFFMFSYRLNYAIKVHKIYNAFKSDQFSEKNGLKTKRRKSKTNIANISSVSSAKNRNRYFTVEFKLSKCEINNSYLISVTSVKIKNLQIIQRYHFCPYLYLILSIFHILNRVEIHDSTII